MGAGPKTDAPPYPLDEFPAGLFLGGVLSSRARFRFTSQEEYAQFPLGGRGGSQYSRTRATTFEQHTIFPAAARLRFELMDEPVRPARGEADNKHGRCGRCNDWLPARGFHHGPERSCSSKRGRRYDCSLISLSLTASPPPAGTRTRRLLRRRDVDVSLLDGGVQIRFVGLLFSQALLDHMSNATYDHSQ